MRTLPHSKQLAQQVLTKLVTDRDEVGEGKGLHEYPHFYLGCPRDGAQPFEQCLKENRSKLWESNQKTRGYSESQVEKSSRIWSLNPFLWSLERQVHLCPWFAK